MPRISNITNFEGEIIASQPWVMTQINNITAGTNSVFIKNNLNSENLSAYMSSLNGVTGNIVIIQAGTAKGNYVFVDNFGNYEKFVEDDELLNQISNLSDRVTLTETDLSNILNKNTTESGTTYTIKTSVLPEIAITRVYTINASEEVNLTKTINSLLASAIGEQEAQTGDLVIITATTQDRASTVAGNYVIVNDVPDSNDISSDDYIKLYTGTGSVVSVNGISPELGNVQLSIENLDDFAVTYSDAIVSDILIKNISMAKKSDVTDIKNIIGDGFSAEYTVENAIADISLNSTIADRVQELEKDTTNINNQQQNNIRAIEKAVELLETTFLIQEGQPGVNISVEYNTDNVTIKNRTVTVTVIGRVLQVWDANGKVVIPDVTYSEGNSTIVAKYGTNSLDVSWTILRTNPIVVEIVETSSEESSLSE